MTTPDRIHLPDTRTGKVIKLHACGFDLYLRTGHYPDDETVPEALRGQVGELFVTMGQEGSTLRGLLDAWAIVVSMSLQRGVPLDQIVAKFRGMAFEPSGYADDGVHYVSLIDAIVRTLDRVYRQEAVESPQTGSKGSGGVGVGGG